jgi:hypothetical protein
LTNRLKNSVSDSVENWKARKRSERFVDKEKNVRWLVDVFVAERVNSMRIEKVLGGNAPRVLSFADSVTKVRFCIVECVERLI